MGASLATRAGREQATAELAAAQFVASLGPAQAPPDDVMGSLAAYRSDAGALVVEHRGGPLLSMSLQLFKQHEPELATMRDGMVIIAGVDPAGDPVELRYRAVGLQLSDPRYLAATEGGYLLLERLS